ARLLELDLQRRDLVGVVVDADLGLNGGNGTCAEHADKDGGTNNHQLRRKVCQKFHSSPPFIGERVEERAATSTGNGTRRGASRPCATLTALRMELRASPLSPSSRQT